ncbi:glycosyltransferase family 4 protein [Desulfovulcanus sp.]
MQAKIWATLDPFVESGPVLGRKIANSSFLKALFKTDPFDAYHFFLPDLNTINFLKDFIRQHFPTLSARVNIYPRLKLLSALQKYNYFCFHLSDCINYPAGLSRLRNRFSSDIFPITSIIHSLSYQHYSLYFLRHLWPGCTVRDALICSSNSGKKVIQKYYNHLRTSYNLSHDFKEPALFTIPLGLFTDEFHPLNPNNKKLIRQELGLAEEKVTMVFLGRISHYSKMDFLPLLRAIQEVFTAGVKKEEVTLVLAGWVDEGEDFLAPLINLSQNIGLTLKIFSRPDEALKKKILAQGDIFISLADNYQETFGLTVLEAQAMGLPVIVSDFDGYKELVQNQKSGFLVPTYGTGSQDWLCDLAPLIFDNQSHLLMAQNVAVDLPALVKHLLTLIQNKELRIRMGEFGSMFVRQHFNWTKIILSYLKLWEKLWNQKIDQDLKAAFHPLNTPYPGIFSHYPSRILNENELIKWSKLGQRIYKGQDFPIMYAGVNEFIREDSLRMLLFLARGPISIKKLALRLCAARELTTDMAEYLIFWSLKQGFLELIN